MIENWLKFSPKSRLWYFLYLFGSRICLGTLGEALTNKSAIPLGKILISNRTQDGGTKQDEKHVTNSKKATKVYDDEQN